MTGDFRRTASGEISVDMFSRAQAFILETGHKEASPDLGRTVWKLLMSKMSITFLLPQKGHLPTLFPAPEEGAMHRGLQ